MNTPPDDDSVAPLWLYHGARSAKKALLAGSCALLVSCGGGGGSGSTSGSSNTPATPQGCTASQTDIDGHCVSLSTQALEGGSFDGLISHATVVAYPMLATGAGVRFAVTSDMRGTTDAAGRVQALRLPATLDRPVLLQFFATEQSIDLGTGEAPVFSDLSTVIMPGEQERAFYATVMTTMASKIALERASLRIDSSASLAQRISVFAQEKAKATGFVVSSLGFGAQENTVDIFHTPPSLSHSDAPSDEAGLAVTAAYRVAIAAAVAVLEDVGEAAGSGDLDDLLETLSHDLLDGDIDGEVNVQELQLGDDVSAQELAQIAQDLDAPAQDVSAQAAEAFQQPVSSLVTTAAIQAAMHAEAQAAANLDGSSISPAIDSITAHIADTVETSKDLKAAIDADHDNDGYGNLIDAFPDNAAEWEDTDSDNIGNNADLDDDDDGVSDTADAFPLDDSEWSDTDKDGIGNNADLDDDGDGTPDTSDDAPLDPSDVKDFDGDGIGDASDDDDDNDGTPDANDAFPFDALESIDTDRDGVGNNADLDDDNDGISDAQDLDPLQAVGAMQLDTTHWNNALWN